MSKANPVPVTETKQSPVATGNINTGKIDFDTLPGESFVGLNILVLDVEETDGPFTMCGIEDKVFGVGKAAKTIGVYQALKGSTPIQMPIAASFIAKAVESALKKGDTFYVKRGRDFKSKDWGTDNCKSYYLKVTARS